MTPNATTQFADATTRVSARPRLDQPSKVPLKAQQQTNELKVRLGQTSLQLQQTAWLVELLERLTKADTLLAAASELTNQFKTQLRCDRVVMAWNQASGKRSILAVSDCAKIDRNAELMMRLQSAVDEAAFNVKRDRNDLVSWPICGEPTGAKPLIHKEIASGGSALTISLTIGTRDVGSLTLIGPQSIVLADHTIGFLKASQPSLAAALECVQRGEKSLLQRVWDCTARQSARRHVGILLAMAALLSIAAMPVNYKIACVSTLEPVQRSFCVAPQDGTVESTTVTPGDVVRRGQTLAKMDGRDVRWELAGLIADQTRAAKKHDTQMAAHDTAEAIQSKLEVERLQAKIDLLRHRESNLTVQSPLDGVVLSGSPDRRENFPVDEGEVLYEVAPLDELRVEINVPNDEISHVRVGQAITLSFDGLSSQTFEATVTKIRPRSESRNNASVYVAECALANPEESLRPGMTGHAKIVGDKHALAWVVFHRAVENVRVMMPW